MTITKGIETREDLEAIVAAQNEQIAAQGALLVSMGSLIQSHDSMLVAHGETVRSMGELVRSMDMRIRLLTDLLDSHQTVIQKLTGISPTPAPDPIVH